MSAPRKARWRDELSDAGPVIFWWFLAILLLVVIVSVVAILVGAAVKVWTGVL